MSIRVHPWFHFVALGFAVIALLWHLPVAAQDAPDLMLTTDSEAAFQQLIRMAQTGQLGDDVTNANVGIAKNRAVVELVRVGAPNKLLHLNPKSSAQATCRHFDIEPGDGVTASDVARVGSALDAVFAADPFQLAPNFFDALPGGSPIPRLADAWRSDGWSGIRNGLERRMVALEDLRYTIAVIVALAAALLASLVLLWGSIPSQLKR